MTSSSSSNLTLEVLKKQNAETSNAIIQYYSSKDNNNEDFKRLADYEQRLTVSRDKEDDEKLELGIEFAKNKGVIDPSFQPEPYVKIDVLGKTPDQVANIILEHVQKSSAKEGDATKDAAGAGSVIVLVGLSGTGKGTTVACLRQKLTAQDKQVVTWSNGNIFRSVTLLAATWCEQQQQQNGGQTTTNGNSNNNNGGAVSLDADKALTKENLASFMKMLTFGKYNGKYDTHIHGLGLDCYVSEVQNTLLKSPKVSKNIPTVAQFTQGEVILFAADAVKTMGEDGWFVLLEGREQTVNYVRTPHRFSLELSDESLIGKRRAAQRLMAAALPQASNDKAVVPALDQALETMVREMEQQE